MIHMTTSEMIDVANPAPLLEEIYRKIQREHMQGLPILNPYLEVEAVGFIPFKGLWLGILITPWFMNLMLLSGAEPCPILAEGKFQAWQFPSGILKFNGGFESELGAYQACSIFAVMGEFSNQEQARTAAQTVLHDLFSAQVKIDSEPEQTQPVGPLAEIKAAIAAPMSKRDFLRGSFLPGRKRET
jgi:[NiFe] hydrogenase assembly HybE family chaperone